MSENTYLAINNFIALESNIFRIQYEKLAKEFKYFVIDNYFTHDCDNGDKFASMFFTNEKDALIFCEKSGHYVSNPSGGTYTSSVACKQNEMKNGVYETQHLVIPETKNYSYSELDNLPALDNHIRKSVSDFFSSIDEYFSFSIDEAKDEIHSDDEYIIIECIYSNTWQNGDYGYEVKRIVFNDWTVGYVTCDGKYLEDISFMISDSKRFKQMIKHIEDTYENKQLDFSQNKITINFKSEFLALVDEFNYGNN
jgi:hypothetical protein